VDGEPLTRARIGSPATGSNPGLGRPLKSARRARACFSIRRVSGGVVMPSSSIKRAFRVGALGLALALSTSAVTRAAPKAPEAIGDEDRASRLFGTGKRLFDRGSYLEAVQVFEAGYAISARPLFLQDIALAYHKGHVRSSRRRPTKSCCCCNPICPTAPRSKRWATS
jgi:hypothetical protein